LFLSQVRRGDVLRGTCFLVADSPEAVLSLPKHRGRPLRSRFSTLLFWRSGIDGKMDYDAMMMDGESLGPSVKISQVSSRPPNPCALRACR